VQRKKEVVGWFWKRKSALDLRNEMNKVMEVKKK
jgi:hypothetical protein